jgi:diguanylate cyclase (GGDEF)-like protein
VCYLDAQWLFLYWQDLIMNSDIRDALKYCPNLPSPPKIAFRILELSQDPEIDLAPLSQLLAQDPALASRVLRASNSALFGQRRRSENLRQAMVTIGLNATLTLALNFSLAESFNGGSHPHSGRYHVWQRALISALTSRLLGERMGLRYLEELSLAALLQDIGILALDAALPETYSALIAQPWQHNALIVHEQTTLGTDHGEAGVWLMRHWGLPERLVLIPSAVHQPHSELIPEKNRVFVNVVAIAGQIADLFLAPQKTEQAAANTERLLAFARETEQVAVNAEQLLALARTEMSPLLEQVAERLPEVAALYDTEIISARMAAGAIDQAREILAMHNLQLIHKVTEQQRTIRDLECSDQQMRRSTASRDALTGLYNRHYFEDTLATEFRQATQSGWPITVGLIDLDHFKSINTTHGHLVGDTVLASVAKILTQYLRKRDTLMRYGGDQFVVVLPGTGSEQAQIICERLRNTIATTPHHSRSEVHLHITVSIGLASHMDQGRRFSNPMDLIQAADQALFQAKSLGRNRLVSDTRTLD